MITVPRDLWYRGKRINTIYNLYGPQQLTREMSVITGLNIEKYIIIDMFAFIDAINILGGIDVHLDEELIDFTYKTKENGQWSTLYYPAGTHHLNGIEALRIARSRHTSDDFDRGARQQRIILSLKDRFSELGLGDIGKIYDLVKVLLKYVETNLSPFEIVTAFLNYKDFPTATKSVLSTDNVLYQTYSNLYYLNKTEDEVDENFNKGAWILFPAGNDWSLIPRYIKNRLSGNTAQVTVPEEKAQVDTEE